LAGYKYPPISSQNQGETDFDFTKFVRQCTESTGIYAKVNLYLNINMHGAVREAELRQLRKQNTEYEEQNAVLSKHVENMKQAIDKLEVEAAQQRKNNDSLQKHLDYLRTTLVANFSRIPLPGKNCDFPLSGR
jgi:septal ring factor EnvC (AmiA/AmiB activator)